jgi:hypothetical protein
MMKWAKKDEENINTERERELQQQLHDEINPKRRWLHHVFILVSIVAGLSALNMALGQFIGIAYGKVGPIQYVLRVYVILLCALVILNELEWTKLTRDSTILHLWVTRGMVYAFIGVLGLEENSTTQANQNAEGRGTALGYIMVVAWLMVGCGTLYFCMGVLCLQLVCNRMREDYQHRLIRSKETRRTTQTYMRAHANNAV